MGEKKAQYTDQQLYDTNGQPQLADIRQDGIYNCYLVSSMGALAAQQPDRIRNAIRYQSDPNNPDAGVFHVTLHHPMRGPVDVPVTQADIEHNIQKSGGGTADNKKGSPIWASVMETAFAKLHDPDPQNKSIDDAYKVIGSETRGGSLHDAMFAFTGEIGHNLRYSNAPKGSSAPPGNNGEPSPFEVALKSNNVTRFNDADGAYAKVREALDADKAVTLSTRNADVNDGLMKHHAYIVTGIEQREKKDGTSEVWITLRNPYAHNNNKPEESKDTSKPSITVSLNKMLDNGVLGEFNLSPAPRLQLQQQSAPAPTPEQITPSQPAPGQSAPTQPAPIQPASSRPVADDITNDKHPGHERYQQALSTIERSPNIPPGTFTDERLRQAAANLAYASLAGEDRPQGGQNERLDRIDFVVFNKQRDGLIAGQGELGSPTAKLAFLPAEQDNATTLTQASEKVHDKLTQQLEQTQRLAQQQPTPMQDDPGPKGPRLS
jgi:Calpain family cysteine protease